MTKYSEAEACLPKAVPLGRTSVSQDPRQQPTSFVLRDVHTYHLPLCHLLSILDSSVFSIHSTWDMTAGPSLPWMTVVRPVHRKDDYPFPLSQTIPLLICLWITPRLSCFCMFHRHFTCNMSFLSLQTGLASCSMQVHRPGTRESTSPPLQTIHSARSHPLIFLELTV